jgi:hypothetical protein
MTRDKSRGFGLVVLLTLAGLLSGLLTICISYTNGASLLSFS